jgi:hypothetical protein
MSDAEHELIVDTINLRERFDRVSVLALRALAAATEAQDVAFGGHDDWIDDAKRELALT